MGAKFRAACGGVAALVALAGPARAADTTASDLHCMIIGSIVGASNNPELKNAGTIMTFYYLGRLDGSGRDVDFTGGYKSEMAKLPKLDLETEAKGCSALLATRAVTLSAMGKQIAPPPGAATPAPVKPAP